MKETFSDPLVRGEVVVDDDGISERRAGGLVVFIPWNQVERLSTDEVRSVMGTKISVTLLRDDRRKFFDCASLTWRHHFPERWQRNRERAKRAGDWAVYFWIPLFTLGSCVACYICYWFLGWPEDLREDLQALHRLTVMVMISVVGVVIWYTYRNRNDAEDCAANGSQPSDSDTNRTSAAADSRR